MIYKNISIGNLLVFLVFTPWAWFIARSRLSSTNAFMFSLFMGFLLVAPRALGAKDNLQDLTYAMVYNRHGFVLLSIFLVQLFIKPHHFTRDKTIFWDGLSSGILLGLLSLCKINFLVVGVAAVLFRLLIFPLSRTWLISFASGFICTFLTIQVFLNGNFLAYLSDLSLASKAQSVSYRLRHLRQILSENYFFFGFIVTLTILLSINEVSNREKREIEDILGLERIRVFIITLFVTLSAWFIGTTNGQFNEIPLFYVAGLILIEQFRQEFNLGGFSINSVSAKKYFWSIIIVTCFFWGNILIKDINSFLFATSLKTFKSASISDSMEFESKTLNDFIVPKWSNNVFPTTTGGITAREYPDKVNDGLTLLRRHNLNNRRVFAWDFANPFPFALESLPPQGDALWWHNGWSFSEKSFLDVEQVFKTVEIIMIPQPVIPKYGSKNNDGSHGTIETMLEIYKDYLNKHFTERASSSYWKLMVRK